MLVFSLKNSLTGGRRLKLIIDLNNKSVNNNNKAKIIIQNIWYELKISK